MPGSGPRRLPRGAGRDPLRLGIFCPGGRHFPGSGMRASLQSCAAPALAPPGLRSVRAGAHCPVCLRSAQCWDLGDEERPEGKRAAEGTIRGTPPVVHTPPLATIVVHSFIYPLVHAFIHSLAISTPSLDCPHTKAGASLLAPGWREGCQPVSPPIGVCSSGPQRPRRQRGAVPARIGRTRASVPSRSGGLGPVCQLRDLIQSRPGRKESSCSWGRGKEAGQAGGGVSGDIKNCGLCPLRSWSPGGWDYLGEDRASG